MMEGSLEGRRECVGDDTEREVGHCIWDVVNSGSPASCVGGPGFHS